MASHTFFTKLAGGAGSASLISAALIGHGTAGLIFATMTVAAVALLRAVTPELFWLVALFLAFRDKYRTLMHLGQDDALREQILARNPAAEIARARAGAASANNK